MAVVNAAVVCVFGAALYDLVWTSAKHSTVDFGIALAACGLLVLGPISRACGYAVGTGGPASVNAPGTEIK
jgi:hypothetical protein